MRAIIFLRRAKVWLYSDLAKNIMTICIIIAVSFMFSPLFANYVAQLDWLKKVFWMDYLKNAYSRIMSSRITSSASERPEGVRERRLWWSWRRLRWRRESMVGRRVVRENDSGRADSRSWRSMPWAVRRPSMTRSL